jgi:hypothetical protein
MSYVLIDEQLGMNSWGQNGNYIRLPLTMSRVSPYAWDLAYKLGTRSSPILSLVGNNLPLSLAI